MSKENNWVRSKRLRAEHSIWRKKQFADKKPFFPVFKEFTEYLEHLSPGAVTLFLYIGLYGNNQSGECYHSIETIAAFFHKTPRTISNWIAELEDIGLIERFQIEKNGVSHTFLRPYPNIELMEFLVTNNKI